MSTINIKSKKVTELTESTELKDSDLFPIHDGTGLKAIKFSNIRDKIISKISETIGDMKKSIYDSDGDGIVDDSKKLGGNESEYFAKAVQVGDKFSVDKDYLSGEYCINFDKLWRFIEDKPAGEWDESKVTLTSCAEEFKSLNSKTFRKSLISEPVQVTATGQVINLLENPYEYDFLVIILLANGTQQCTCIFDTKSPMNVARLSYFATPSYYASTSVNISEDKMTLREGVTYAGYSSLKIGDIIGIKL